MNELPPIGFRDFLLWLLRRRRRLRVTGHSMQPLLKPGDEILIDPYAYQGCEPQPGHIVVARHPHQTNLHLIKRVTGITDEHLFILTGDNPAESTDSRMFGPVSATKIIGRVTSRFA